MKLSKICLETNLKRELLFGNETIEKTEATSMSERESLTKVKAKSHKKNILIFQT